MAGSSGFNVNVPEPTTVQLEGNKTDVYERQQARREKDRRMQSLSDLAGRLLEGKGQTDSVSGPDGSIRQSADTYERITEQLETFYETPQETAGGLEQKVDELNRRLEEAEAENRRAESRERMMEQSYRMAARYLSPKPEATPGEAEEEKSRSLSLSAGRRSERPPPWSSRWRIPRLSPHLSWRGTTVSTRRWAAATGWG